MPGASKAVEESMKSGEVVLVAMEEALDSFSR
jgi:hypothetical protein